MTHQEVRSGKEMNEGQPQQDRLSRSKCEGFRWNNWLPESRSEGSTESMENVSKQVGTGGGRFQG